MKIPEKLKSRKWQLAAIAMLLIILNGILNLNMPMALELALVGVIIAYIGGESWIDKKRVEVEEYDGPNLNT